VVLENPWLIREQPRLIRNRGGGNQGKMLEFRWEYMIDPLMSLLIPYRLFADICSGGL
jgi:hypothetical protein